MKSQKPTRPTEVRDNQVTGKVVPESSATQLAAKSFPWRTLAKALAGMAAVGGVVLHLMGYISHQTYLTTWGIDPGLFPKTTDATIIGGYRALVDRAATLLLAVNQGVWKYFGAGAAVALYLFLMLRLSRSNESEKAIHLPRKTSRKTPEWLGDLVKSFALTFVAIAGLPVALGLAGVVLVIPAFFGSSFGQSVAEREMERYPAGCEQKDIKCVELRKEGKLIVRGFLIDSSESHIALFDVAEKRARALEREGTELLSDLPCKAHENNCAGTPINCPSQRRLEWRHTRYQGHPANCH